MSVITTFETNLHYIILPVFVWTHEGKQLKFKAILDTGAPRTEFSDKALEMSGFNIEHPKDIEIQNGLQTCKYDDIDIPRIEICSHVISNLKVYVSRFEKSWGIDALIGLDFFRRFKVTVDYSKGRLITEPL